MPNALINYSEWLLPHLTWIAGLLLVYEAFYPRSLSPTIAEYPQATLFIAGVLVVISGRLAVNCRKELNRHKREDNIND